MTLFPRRGQGIRAHTIFFQAQRVYVSDIGIVTLFGVTRASASAVTIAAGTYKYNNTISSYAGSTISSIPAASAGTERIDAIVFDCSTLAAKRIAGVEATPAPTAGAFWENEAPTPPELENESQILLATCLVTASGIPSDNRGNYATSGVADHRLFLSSALGVSGGDAHDHTNGKGAQIAHTSLSGAGTNSHATIDLFIAQKAANSGLASLNSNGLVVQNPANASQTAGEGKIPVAGSDGKIASTFLPSIAGFWMAFPATVTRVSDTQFTMPDSSGGNGYAARFPKGTIISWKESTTQQFAMVSLSSYANNVATYTITGNSLGSNFTSLKYCIHRARREVFEIPGFQPGNTATSDISHTWIPEADVLVISADAVVGAAATGSSTIWDINDDGSSVFSTKPTIASGGTSDLDNICDCLVGNTVSVIAAGSKVTVDYDSGNASNPAKDAKITLFYLYAAWGYET